MCRARSISRCACCRRRFAAGFAGLPVGAGYRHDRGHEGGAASETRLRVATASKPVACAGVGDNRGTTDFCRERQLLERLEECIVTLGQFDEMDGDESRIC